MCRNPHPTELGHPREQPNSGEKCSMWRGKEGMWNLQDFTRSVKWGQQLYYQGLYGAAGWSRRKKGIWSWVLKTSHIAVCLFHFNHLELQPENVIFHCRGQRCVLVMRQCIWPLNFPSFTLHDLFSILITALCSVWDSAHPEVYCLPACWTASLLRQRSAGGCRIVIRTQFGQLWGERLRWEQRNSLLMCQHYLFQ